MIGVFTEGLFEESIPQMALTLGIDKDYMLIEGQNDLL